MEFFTAFRFLIAVVALVVVAETIVSVFWLPFYYRRGIRLRQRSIFGTFPVNRSLRDVLDCSTTGFCFRSIGPDEVAFRDPLFRLFKPAPVIHGSIRCHGSKIEVRLLANWALVYVGFLFLLCTAWAFLLVGFLALASLVVTGGFLAYWVFSFTAQSQRVDDLVTELTANTVSTVVHTPVSQLR